MSEFVNTIDLHGDEATVKALIERTITEFNDNVITNITDCVFYACKDLTSADIPNVVSIGNSAFRGCSKLTRANFPNVTALYDSAFRDCSSLESVNLPLATFPVASAGSMFYRCSKLKHIKLPSFEKVSLSMFEGCTSLESADFLIAEIVVGSAFRDCTSLKFLILRRSSGICSMSQAGALYGTPFYSGDMGGTLIVPRALVTEYPNATNWSYDLAENANNRVLALEDYTVDGTITGEIDWNKLNGGAV